MKILEKTGVLKRVNTVITNDGIGRIEEILRHIHALGGVKQINELADILHNVIRIADYYGIDLESAHLKARADEAALIESLKSGRQTY